ncbi:MAG: acetyl-CoA acetyltransferase, partial [Candidatus Bathyarchaeia archaeon]
KYGTTEEQMALVAVKNHKNAFMNPKAHFHKEITVEDVLKSPMVASPLKLLDCCPFSDGAAAAVLCSEETARKRGGPLVYVLASGRSGGTSALHLGEEPTSLRSARLAAGQAFNQCNLTPRDIDVAEVHDCFTIAEIVALEDVGFAKPGEGSHLVEEGRTALTGDIPVNTSGGLKAKGHPIGATGIGQIAELYLQLTGKAGPRQVKDAKTALAHNVGATGGSCAVHILQSG